MQHPLARQARCAAVDEVAACAGVGSGCTGLHEQEVTQRERAGAVASAIGQRQRGHGGGIEGFVARHAGNVESRAIGAADADETVV